LIFGIPWTVLIVILFIFFTGYMSFRAMRAEKIMEQQFIEREGKIYIDRMEREKEKRRSVN